MKWGSVPAILLVVLSSFCLYSCGNKLQTREAVERGVRKGVAQRGLSPDAMDISVTSVKFHGNKADATVSFAPKGGKLSDGLTMNYTLEQRDSEWVIVSRSHLEMKDHTGGLQPGSPHSGAQPMATPIPGVDAQPLPAGHPPMDGSPQ